MIVSGLREKDPESMTQQSLVDNYSKPAILIDPKVAVMYIYRGRNDVLMSIYSVLICLANFFSRVKSPPAVALRSPQSS